jgi:hypothetical protein
MSIEKIHITRDIEKIIERMRIAAEVKNDVELAKYLKIKPNSITSWKTQNTIPYKHIDVISENKKCSFEWILSGEFPIGVREHQNQYIAHVVSMMEEMDEETQRRSEGDVQEKKLIMDLKRQVEEKKAG